MKIIVTSTCIDYFCKKISDVLIKILNRICVSRNKENPA